MDQRGKLWPGRLWTTMRRDASHSTVNLRLSLGRKCGREDSMRRGANDLESDAIGPQELLGGTGLQVTIPPRPDPGWTDQHCVRDVLHNDQSVCLSPPPNCEGMVARGAEIRLSRQLTPHQSRFESYRCQEVATRSRHC